MTVTENTKLAEGADVGAGVGHHEPVQWRCSWKVEKYDDTPSALVLAGQATPTEVIEREGNLLVYGGADVLWQGLIGSLSTAQHFDNGNALIGVGNSTVAAAATQTGLQASSGNRWYGAMSTGYPSHSTGTGSTSNADVSFRAVASTADANFAWQEWGIFNSTSGGRMLNRRVESLGTKTASATWTFTVKLSLS